MKLSVNIAIIVLYRKNETILTSFNRYIDSKARRAIITHLPLNCDPFIIMYLE